MKVRQSYQYGLTKITVRYLYNREKKMIGAQEINCDEKLHFDELEVPSVQLTNQSYVSLIGVLRIKISRD